MHARRLCSRCAASSGPGTTDRHPRVRFQRDRAGSSRWKVREHPIILPAAAVNRHSRMTAAHVRLPDGPAIGKPVMSPTAVSVQTSSRAARSTH